MTNGVYFEFYKVIVEASPRASQELPHRLSFLMRLAASCVLCVVCCVLCVCVCCVFCVVCV